jgi:hypothetical protein
MLWQQQRVRSSTHIHVLSNLLPAPVSEFSCSLSSFFLLFLAMSVLNPMLPSATCLQSPLHGFYFTCCKLMYWKNVYKPLSINVLSGQKIPCLWQLYVFLKPHVISHYIHQEHGDFILKILILPFTENLYRQKCSTIFRTL